MDGGEALRAMLNTWFCFNTLEGVLPNLRPCRSTGNDATYSSYVGTIISSGRELRQGK